MSENLAVCPARYKSVTNYTAVILPDSVGHPAGHPVDTSGPTRVGGPELPQSSGDPSAGTCSSRRNVPAWPPVFSQRATSEISMVRSTDLHMS